MVTFGFERGLGFVSDLVETDRLLSELVVLARKVTRRSATAWDDVALRREIGHLQAEMDALWAMTKRNLSQAARTGVPGPGGSVVKVAYSELFQRITDLAMRVLERGGLSRDDLGDWPSGRVRGGAAALHLVHHRRRDQPDPAQHRGRAHPRPAPGVSRDADLDPHGATWGVTDVPVPRAPPADGGSKDGFRAVRGSGRAAGRRAQLLRRPVPDRRGARPGRRRRASTAARWRELAELGRVLAAPGRGRRRRRAGLGRHRAGLRGAGPGPGAGAAGVDPPAGRPRCRARPTGEVVVGGHRASTIPAAWSSTRPPSTCWPCSTTTGCGRVEPADARHRAGGQPARSADARWRG